jgi:pectate lyase
MRILFSLIANSHEEKIKNYQPPLKENSIMNGKNRIWFSLIVVGIIMLLSPTAFTANTCSAATVWSDDFNDGNYAGWTLEIGSFSAADNTLRGTTTPSAVRHDTTVNQGTWSFDVLIAQATGGVFINLFAETVTSGVGDGCYCLTANQYLWRFLRRTGGSNTQLDSYDPTETITGWYHIDVTRDSGGQFYLWINGTHRMDVADTVENTANYFTFYCGTDEALDNVVISNTVDIAAPTTDPGTGTGTGTTPPPIPGFPLASIVIGGALALGVGFVTRKRQRNT